MNIQQACQTLNVDSGASFEDVKGAYRKLALAHHPDKNKTKGDDIEFKKITEAYHYLKNEHKNFRKSETPKWTYTEAGTKKKQNFKDRSKWGPSPGKTPEEDWSRFTKDFEESDPDWWKEYERKFWEEYNDTINADGKKGEYEKAKEPKKQPNLFVDVDASLCIACCSCETIAPEVFSIDKFSHMNPKSKVINPKGAGINKIMNAAETCPTKAIIVENKDTEERLYPF
ncbi:MAG TPA: DnaJ domain-containing protein [Nitrosopumilaceae archaeon]|nr:DnaJ domain-containing protein [Nitrosopumilaceae archaeon]